MSRKVSPERKANLERAVRLVVQHGASYQSVAQHCNLPIGTVAHEVWKWRRQAGIDRRYRYTALAHRA